MGIRSFTSPCGNHDRGRGRGRGRDGGRDRGRGRGRDGGRAQMRARRASGRGRGSRCSGGGSRCWRPVRASAPNVSRERKGYHERHAEEMGHRRFMRRDVPRIESDKQ